MRFVTTDELEAMVGTETGASRWFAIDQDRIDAFADATEDHQWIHVDQDAAEAGPFGTTVAHGFLTLSLLVDLLDEASLLPAGASMYLNYGSDRIRYLAPVKTGSRIRAVNTLKDVTSKGDGRVLVTNSVVVEIEGEDTPALVADILYLAILDG